jgi:uncharacterized protein YqgC (DUF456 family)
MLILLACVGLVCLVGVALNLPGLWVYLAFGVLLELCDGFWGVDTTVGWLALGATLGLALLGEAIEAGSSILGAKAGDGTRRGAIGSLLGAIIGGIAFSFIIPIPILGGLCGLLVGTFIGALVGELTGKEAKEINVAWKPALFATAARVVGTAAKVCISTAAWFLCTTASIYHLWGDDLLNAL